MGLLVFRFNRGRPGLLCPGVCRDTASAGQSASTVAFHFPSSPPVPVPIQSLPMVQLRHAGPSTPQIALRRGLHPHLFARLVNGSVCFLSLQAF
ncbi:hypothetical protein T11_13539 [Trichinella zimbabwensis]|uniref:Uncharacterized protein n=1 Tax=Trichinella zimbabwensis TaxID=268475 RepID=A0A0V1HVY5_9BILA|nr:hypothetical protein T11_13539 [Trichinella zimbabwensis]